MSGIRVSATPEPETLLPLDHNGKFPESVLPVSGFSGDFLRKNEPDTSQGSSTGPMLVIMNEGDGTGISSRGNNNSGIVVWTGATDRSGVFGHSIDGRGVSGRSTNGLALQAISDNGDFFRCQNNSGLKFIVNNAGNVGIGIPNPQERLQVDGIVHSIAGGFKFPDGTVQTSAATGSGTPGNFIKKNTPDTSVAHSSIPLLLINNIGDGDGFNGRSINGRGIVGRSFNNDGTVGWTGASNKSGVYGHSTDGIGITAQSTNGLALQAYSDNGNFFSCQNSSGVKFLVNNAGNVGIGTSLPDSKLDIDFGSIGSMLAGTPANSGPGWIFFAPNGHRRDILAENGGIGIGTGATSGPAFIYFFINEEGYVGIGTKSPSNILTITRNSNTDPIANAWTTYSSRRWKTNIKSMEGALDKVKRLRGVTFDWKADGKHDIGLIAEEVGEVVPEVVTYEDNSNDAKSIDYARLVPVLIEAIKEQQKEIDELKRTVKSFSDGKTAMW